MSTQAAVGETLELFFPALRPGEDVGDAAGAPALAFAARRGGAKIGAPWIAARRYPRRSDRRPDVCARRHRIGLMPPRGTLSLWPVRILTDFGKSAYVLWLLAGMLFAVAIISPRLRATSRSLLLGFGTRLQFLFFAVLVPVLTGEAIKWVVGRGRPFVGGEANAFNFAHFAGTEAYASFPSGHAITSFALAFAVSAVWPRARAAMIVYAVLIAISRLVLLAHHPSDVVAGALIGVVGAMFVRYWFAARRLGFAIRRDGALCRSLDPRWGHLKGLPARRQPHKKRTPQTLDMVLPAAGQLKR